MSLSYIMLVYTLPSILFGLGLASKETLVHRLPRRESQKGPHIRGPINEGSVRLPKLRAPLPCIGFPYGFLNVWNSNRTTHLDTLETEGEGEAQEAYVPSSGFRRRLGRLSRKASTKLASLDPI